MQDCLIWMYYMAGEASLASKPQTLPLSCFQPKDLGDDCMLGRGLSASGILPVIQDQSLNWIHELPAALTCSSDAPRALAAFAEQRTGLCRPDVMKA